MEETSSDYDTVSTQPPSGNETAVTIGQFGLQGWGPRNLSTKTEMSFSSRSTVDSISKHIISFPSIICIQWQQPNKPYGLHFYVCRSSKKCHQSRNCCYTDWVFCWHCTCTQGLIDSNSYGRIINVQHVLRARKQAVVKKNGKSYYSVIVFLLCHYCRNKSTILITLYELPIVNPGDPGFEYPL